MGKCQQSTILIHIIRFNLKILYAEGKEELHKKIIDIYLYNIYIYIYLFTIRWYTPSPPVLQDWIVLDATELNLYSISLRVLAWIRLGKYKFFMIMD